ncbi:DUF2254 domain-containing protein [Akkermansia sp.]|uniref:DUF2254 domain-containing protein n=1 Tax=Akkermansia sp. TaxID=1872421 RepID=UPI0039917FDD
MRANKLLWVKATYFALLAIITAIASIYLGEFVPFDIFQKIGPDTVDTILNILASSMLAVTTFSLTTVVSAYAAATSSVTPRATKLLMEDSTAQNALSTFIGSFIFSLIAIIFLNSGMYDQKGRVVLFVVTLGVIAIILVTLIRWIEHLSRLGRVGETSELVEGVTQKALLARAREPYLGANPLADRELDIPENAVPVRSELTGNIQYIDMGKLDHLSRDRDLDIYVISLPGDFVSVSSILVYVDKPVSTETRHELLGAFVVGHERNFEQDPRFGLCVLAEIAARALSAAINDYGTSIDIINRGVRLLTNYAQAERHAEVKYERVWVPPLTVSNLFSDIFAPILRDEGGITVIDIKLLKAFAELYNLDNRQFKEEARKYSRQCYEHALRTVVLDEDRETLKKLVID